jgi:zinc protease
MGKYLLLFIMALTTASGEPAPEGPLVTVLDNGLTVITQEFHYAPVVASVITYRVGSRNETGDLLGMSHFCEHMMFKGTADMRKSRFWQIVQRDGGMANAFTSNDITCYFLVLPSSRLSDALAIESDRMTNCLFDSAEVASERNVVHEERRSSVTDSPWGVLWETLGETAFTVHPYRHPVLGYDENILSWDREMAAGYYRDWYCPSNAVLSIVGDFDTVELLADVNEYFGGIPAGAAPPEPGVSEPVQTEARLVEIEHQSNLPRFVMAFHTPDGASPDSPVLNIIATHLSSGRSSRLQQVLTEPGLVREVDAWVDSGIDPGLFYIAVTMMPPGEGTLTMEEVQEIIWSELVSLASTRLPDSTLADLRNRYMAGEVLSSASPLGLAMDYGQSASMYGDPMHSEAVLEQVMELQPEDLMDASAAYFGREQVTLAVLLPSGEGAGIEDDPAELPTDITEPSNIDYEGLEIPSEFLAPPSIDLAEGVRRFVMDSGMVLLVREDHTFPVAAVSFTVPMGILRVPDGLDGLCRVTVEMMIRGTGELEQTAFHRRLEREGSYLRFGEGSFYSTGAVTLLSEDLEVAFECVSDLLMRPAFRESDMEVVMGEALSDVELSGEEAFSVAWDSLQIITAAVRSEAEVITVETLGSIHLDMVRDFHLACCRPGGTVIAVAGDVDPDSVALMVDHWFGDWENPAVPLPDPETPAFSPLPGDTVIAYMPGKVQSTVLIGRNAPGFMSPDHAAFSIMNTILGRGIGSRLGHSVRDEQGLAYGVGSWSSSLDSTGTFTAYLMTLSDYVPQATASVMAEMERIASVNVDEIELLLAKANAVGRQAMSGAGYSEQASRLAMLESDGRPLDWDTSWLRSVLSLSADDLREAAARYLVPGEWFLSIAGGYAGPLE